MNRWCEQLLTYILVIYKVLIRYSGFMKAFFRLNVVGINSWILKLLQKFSKIMWIFLLQIPIHVTSRVIHLRQQLPGSTIRTLLHGKINPKDWQLLCLGDGGFLLFSRVVSGDYGKPWLPVIWWLDAPGLQQDDSQLFAENCILKGGELFVGENIGSDFFFKWLGCCGVSRKKQYL